MNSKTLYLPGLNGIRAIAALGVLGTHIIDSFHLVGLSSTFLGFNDDGEPNGWILGTYGVTMFFTLSGFLITYLLLKEKEVQPIQIKDFYMRRILRIWPLYYTYLIVALIAAWFFHQFIDWKLLPYYVFLAANIPVIFNLYFPFLGHYWSLAIEEQFYLVFPFLARVPNKKLFKVIILLIIVFLLAKAICWYFYKFHQINLPFRIITIYRLHTMLFGAAAAILYYQNNATFIKITQSYITQFICWLILILTVLNQFHIASVIDGDLISLATVCIIIAQITKTHRIFSLENKVLVFLGKISYGIYVIHILVIFLWTKILGKFETQDILNYIITILLITFSTIILAYLSYEYLEKPFLRRKKRFSRILSSSSPNKN